MPPPLIASNGSSASRRGPILLPGFDRDEQLKLDFSSPGFEAQWLRRVYTDENQPKVRRSVENLPPEGRESLLRVVRYGNNITLLFRACSHLRIFLGAPEFWSAVASGFSAASEQASYMVETLARAREIYVSCHPHDGPRSATTVAADHWINGLSRGFKDDAHRSTPGDVSRTASKYYADAKSIYLQNDSANMLSGAVLEEPRPGRKRSSSPSFTGPPRSKRGPSETNIGPGDSSQALTTLSIPHSTGKEANLRILGQARFASQASTSTCEAVANRNDFSDRRSPGLINRPVMRGHPGSDSFDSASLRPRGLEDYQNLEFELLKAQNRRRLALIKGYEQNEQNEQKRAVLPGQLPDDSISRRKNGSQAEVGNNRAHTEVLAASKDPTKDAENTIASLRDQLAEAERRRLEDTEKAQAMIAALDSKLSALYSREQSTDRDESLARLQSRVSSLETNLNARLSILAENQQRVEYQRNTSDSSLKGMEDRIVALETQQTLLLKPAETATTPEGQSMPRDTQQTVEDLLKTMTSLPSMKFVSERTLEIEQSLIMLLEEHKKDTSACFAATMKDLEDVKSQIKVLRTLPNGATSTMANVDSLARHQNELAILSRRSDDADSRFTILEELAKKVKELGNDFQRFVRFFQSTNVTSRLLELDKRVEAVEQMAKADKSEALTKDLALLHDQCSTLTAAMSGLMRELARPRD